eukprot:TRINITY_DN21071_c0_g1_i1.p1 TRINITY_DN21071_c0_g1~~TRINITY_DN21071_c0_g1_i1.p1  ORF type:complete len:352 (+),score=25.69 TRINITY_DN21071_c0_g1_i1:70-1125(+)
MVECYSAINIFFAMACVFIGWLSPQYVSAFCGADLGVFLSDSPFSASCIAQTVWALLFSVALAKLQKRSVSHCSPTLGCTVRRVDGSLDADLLATKSDAYELSADMWLPICCGFLVMMSHASWYMSFSLTTVAINTVLWNTGIITTPLLSAIFFRRRPSGRFMLCAFLCFLGICFSVGSAGGKNSLWGCFLCFAGSVGYALNAVLVEKYLDSRRMPVTTLLAWEGMEAILVFVIGTAAVFVFSPEAGRAKFATLPSIDWMLFLGINSVVLQIGWLLCTKHAGAAWVAMLGCCSIPISFVLDTMLLGEQHGLVSIMGAGVILFSFVLAQFDGGPPPSLKSDVCSDSTIVLPA